MNPGQTDEQVFFHADMQKSILFRVCRWKDSEVKPIENYVWIWLLGTKQ